MSKKPDQPKTSLPLILPPADQIPKELSLAPPPSDDLSTWDKRQLNALEAGKEITRRKSYRRITVDLLEKYIERVKAHGSLTRAAREVHITSRAIEQYANVDPTFADLQRDAVDAYNESVEKAVHDHAVEGIEEPVYQMGKLVGTKKVYSERLLELLAKRRMPEYRDKQQPVVDVRIEGGVVVVPQPARSEADFAKFADSEVRRTEVDHDSGCTPDGSDVRGEIHDHQGDSRPKPD